MDLFIGRKRTANQLTVTVNGKEYPFGKAGDVPNTVSENHCHIRIVDNDMRIINLKEGLNYTWVDGMPVTEAGINEDSQIALGGNEWPLNLKEILGYFRQLGMLKSVPEKPYEISHLEEVYNKFNDENIQIQIKQGQFNAIRGVTSILSPFAIMGGVFLGNNGSYLTLGIYTLLIGSGIFFVYHQWKNSKVLPLKREKLLKEFQANYICPNPECRRSFGVQPFNELKKMKTCPFCKKPLVSDGSGIVSDKEK